MRYDTELATAIPLRRLEAAPENLLTLFGDHSLDAYRLGMQRCVSLVHHSLSRHQRPFSGVEPDELQPEFDAIDLDRPLPNVEAGLEEIQRLYLDHAVHFHNPSYVAHLNCPVTLPSILAEAIATPLNTAVETWDQSAGATLIEQKLIDWTTARIGLGDAADGVFTSGGTQSNLMALMIARDAACAELPGHAGNRHHGLPADYRRLRILTSEVSHFSVQKAASLLGLGYDAVIPVPCDDDKRMSLEALRARLEDCHRDALLPFAVVATAGTTDFGSIDPIPGIAELCRSRGIWLHVDAAYGGGLLLSRRYRHWLAGIEQADSVSVDYHKTFFQPVSCSACLVRDRRQLGHVTYHADYLNPRDQADQGTPDLVNKSLQTTRRFDALKLWLTLRTLGAATLGGYLDDVIALTRRTYALLQERDDIDVLTAPALSTLVFRYRPAGIRDDATIEAINHHVRHTLSRRGEGVVAGTRVDECFYLKFTLLNPQTQIEDMRRLIERIVAHGEAFVADHGHLETASNAAGYDSEVAPSVMATFADAGRT
ncbi:L-2,4-diaminobutyrate decarboxylase [Kushneria avicenniae]|uniref:L-2,4-diaminobutyrate decarboxylase n=1 Tax=Kushneria avicenniae TaxID=402385 RepID=A0A1I1LJY9_9GAMM|nr:aspartate aminotransferase family protein [Kushneria avicenniae]SFC73517.1 L-2,4-diaminobutyrate decarboxylase [Kushneria avicenniae]